jgi:uncharacterized protein with PQ loop repeat
MIAIDLLAGGWGIAMGLSPLFQLRRILRRRHSADVSLAMLFVIIVGAALWLCYGIEHRLVVVVIANTVACVAYALTIAVAWRFRST